MNGHIPSDEVYSNGGKHRDDESLALAIASLNRTLLQNQQVTIQALREISSRMERLEQTSANDATDNLCIERATVRLDGLEVYAVVSALVMATSIQCFDSHGGGDVQQWERLMTDGDHFQAGTNLLFLACSALGLVAGMHATLVFSLMTMYGRTAVGIGTERQFNRFFGDTGAMRYRGFQTFRASLYFFLFQVLLMVVEKSPPELRIVGLS